MWASGKMQLQASDGFVFRQPSSFGASERSLSPPPPEGSVMCAGDDIEKVNLAGFKPMGMMSDFQTPPPATAASFGYLNDSSPSRGTSSFPSSSLGSSQVQRLLFASFVHTSLLGLIFALLVCWQRFSWIERKEGTLGFLLWFMWTSFLLHVSYCFAMVCIAPFVPWNSGLFSEVHGLFPLLTASLVSSIKDSDSSTVWLWPLPYHVPVHLFPLVIIGVSWFLHVEAHFDVVIAYGVASVLPWLVEPSAELLEWVEQSNVGSGCARRNR